MKRFTTFFAFFVALACVFLMSGCEFVSQIKEQIIPAEKSEVNTATQNKESEKKSDVATTEHVHEFGEWTVIREATCTEKGLEKRVCACGERETRDIAPTGHKYADDCTCHDRTCTVEGCGHVEVATTSHNFGEWEVVTAATCDAEGQQKRTCKDCQYVEEQVVTVSHEFDENGICANCKKDVRDIFLESVRGSIITVDAANGYYELSNTEADTYAKIPGKILTGLKEMGYSSITLTCVNPATGAADADPKMKSVYVAAEEENNLWSADTAIAMYNPNPFWDAGKVVHITIDLDKYAGKDIYIFTTYANSYPLQITVREFIDLDNKSKWIVGEDSTTVNYYEGKGWVISAADGNAYYARLSADVVQRYISDGYKSVRFYFKNSLGVEDKENAGNYVNNDTRIMPKNSGGDNWDYWNGEFVISQFCTYDETTDSWWCDVDLTDETHVFTRYIRFYFAANDGANATPNAYISNIEFSKEDAHKHVYNWTVIANATCENKGTEKGVCECGKEKYRAIDALGHTYADECTCHDRTCTVEGCGHVEKATTEHTYGDWEVVTAATCTVDGLKKHVCTCCGYEETEVIAALGHTYADELTCHDRTCTVEGCGYVEKATTEHTFGDWVVTKEATYTEVGEEKRTCACGFEETKVIEKLAHNYGDWEVVTAATCTEKGLEKRYCQDCEAEESREIPALGHTYADELTCHDRTCTVEGCGHVEKATTEHTYGDWETVVAATCTEAGSRKHVCVCGHEETEVVNALGHTYGEWEIISDSTCTEDGSKKHVCACGYEETAVIPAGHKYDSNGVCTCGSDLKKSLFESSRAEATIITNVKDGCYELGGTGSDTYAKIPGSVLTKFKELGYSTLTITCTNPAIGAASEEKMKFLFIAAESEDNLWSATTAILFLTGNDFWSAGKTATITLDLNTYAGVDIHFYSSLGSTYPLKVSVKEFVDYEDKTNWITGEEATAVNYYEGKGWVISAADNELYYARLSADVVQYYVNKGANYIRFEFANDLGIQGISNTGNYVNNDTRIMPKNSGGDDWNYWNDVYYISQYCKYDANTGNYYCYIDLNDTTHDFTRYIRFYFAKNDSLGSATPNAYIANIEFLVEPKLSDYIIGSASSTVTYTEGVGYTIAANDPSNAFDCYLSGTVMSYYISQGYTTMIISYSNNLDGNSCPNVGNFVNTTSRLLPIAAGSGEDWAIYGTYISQVGVYNSVTGCYDQIIDLTNATYDFTVNTRFYMVNSDVAGNNVSRAYIASITFLTEPKASDYLLSGTNSTVTYTQGVGYTIAAVDPTNAFDCSISGDVMSWYINQGYTKMVISYSNNLDGNDCPNVGNFVNTTSRVLPITTAGGEDWSIYGTYISQVGTYNNATGCYDQTIDLTNEAYNFTTNTKIYMVNSDVNGNAVSKAYIASITFTK